MRYLLFFMTMLALTTLSQAQTEASTSTVGPRPTRIWSDSGYFDINNRMAVYTGNVRVDDPELQLKCDRMTARTPEQGGRVDDVVAEGHVVVDMTDAQGQTNHATGDKLVYSYKVVNWVTNDTAVLTGHPRVISTQGTVNGTKITFDRVSGRMNVESPQMTYWPSTNAPAITNKPVNVPPPAPPPAVPAVTNRPVVVPVPVKAPIVVSAPTNLPPTNAPPRVIVTNVPAMTNVMPTTKVPVLTNVPPATDVPASPTLHVGKH